MKKSLIVVGTGIFVCLVMACGGLSNEDACKKYDSLCSSSSGAGDGGTSTVTAGKCDPNGFDKMSNDSEVKDCIDSASDCNAALACALKAKKK